MTTNAWTEDSVLKIMVFQNADAQDNIMVVIVNKKVG